VQAALRAPAREREREVGLGPEGPVLSALSASTSTGATPVTGQALFFAVANGDGDVVSIRLVQGSGARGPWDDVASAALAALRAKKLRLPGGARGAEMTIAVSTSWKLPSGHDPGTDVSVLRVPITKGEGKQSTQVSVLDPIPKVEVVPTGRRDPNEPTQPDPSDPLNKIRIPQVVFTILRVDGDPVDLGAKPRRVVHAWLVQSKVL
jgi:hypothetical protein